VGYKVKMSDTDALYTFNRQSHPQTPPPLRHEIDPARRYAVVLFPPGGSLGDCRVEEVDDSTWLAELLDVEISFPPEDLVFRPVFLMGTDSVARLANVTAYAR
jgi:hypothetical protein